MDIGYSLDPGSEVTYQHICSNCPFCHREVRFALQEENRQSEADAKYYSERCHELREENKRLEAVIDRMLMLAAVEHRL